VSGVAGCRAPAARDHAGPGPSVAAERPCPARPPHDEPPAAGDAVPHDPAEAPAPGSQPPASVPPLDAPAGVADAPRRETRAPAGPVEVFPGVRVDRAERIVEFEGVVPIDAHDPSAPWVPLELIACTPDTREHEALVMTSARAEHVHAALLLVGLEPGAPGEWWLDEAGTLRTTDPRGPRVRITFLTTGQGGVLTEHDPRDWIVSIRTGRVFDAARTGAWVFAGSKIVPGGPFAGSYAAQHSGALIGLATFGDECLGWHEVISHDSNVQEEEWIARAEAVPRVGTSVTVRLTGEMP